MQFFKDAIEFFKSGAVSCFGSEEVGRKVLIVLGVMSLLHLLTVFVSKIISHISVRRCRFFVYMYLPNAVGGIFAYLNILVHVAAVAYFMWLKLTIYQAVLAFMASVFVYTVFNLFPYLISKSAEKKIQKKIGGADR